MLTQKRLKELMHYDPSTGEITRLVGRGNQVKVGSVVGYQGKDAYLRVNIDENKYLCHRLAFLYMEGYFPEHHVDHNNGIRDDNRWSNLDHATPRCNGQNCKVNSNNTSGFPGVCWDKRDELWFAQAKLNRERINLGCRYTNKLDAALARLTWEVNCVQWHCNIRGEIVKAIQAYWPELQGSRV